MPTNDEEIELNQEGEDLGPVLKRFSKTLLRFYPLVLVYVVVISLGVAGWSQLQTPLYRSTSTILIDPTLVANAAEKQSLENLSLQAALISSPGILNRVIDKYNLKSIYPFNRGDNALAILQSQMSVMPNARSKTIDVSVLSVAAEDSAKIANAIAETYVYSSEKKSEGTTQESLASLQLSFTQEMEKQEAVKAKVEDFKKQHTEIDDDTEGEKQLTYFSAELTKSDGQLIELNAKISELDQYKKETGSIYNHPYILENPVIARGMERVRNAESSLEELTRQYRGMHPDVISAQARLDSFKKSAEQDSNQAYEQLKLESKTLGSSRDRMRGQLELLKKKLKSLDPLKVKLKTLLDQQEVIGRTIGLIQSRMSVASVDGGLNRPGVEILNRAKSPDVPSWPNKTKLVMGAFTFGMISSLGLLFLYCYFDRSVRTYEDIERVTGKLFLGDLPYAKVKKGQIYPEFPNDKSFIAFTHGLRLIATNIEFVLSDRHQKCILFTSAIPGEGKSFVSFHIAQSMARQGKRVVLIDADFCQSSLRNALPRTECELHLQEYLSGGAEIGDIIEGTDNELIHFIRSGQRSSFSAPHALKSSRMKDLLTTLKEHYDYVLVDTPPILPVNDTLALSQLVDMRVIIVRWAGTHRDLVRKAVAKIAPGQLILAGVVLNQVKETNEKGYHIYRPN